MEVTEKQLAAALDGMEIAVNVPGPCGRHVGTPVNSREVAERVLHWLRLEDEDEPRRPAQPAIADPEAATLVAALTALAVIADEPPGETHGAVWRVLQYLADRYGYVLATED